MQFHKFIKITVISLLSIYVFYTVYRFVCAKIFIDEEQDVIKLL